MHEDDMAYEAAMEQAYQDHERRLGETNGTGCYGDCQELAALRARVTQLESDNATLAAECLVGRDYLQPHCYVDCRCVFCRRIRAARAATDAAGALDRVKGGA